MSVLFDHPEFGRLGDKEVCATICGVTAKTWMWYVGQQKPAGNPPPRPVYIDPQDQRRFWVLRDVRSWHESRPTTQGKAWSRAPLDPNREPWSRIKKEINS